jgi:hypothetical protein
MKGLLVRVGMDQSKGGGCWNAPYDPDTGEFTYIPIPEATCVKFRDGYAPPFYEDMEFCFRGKPLRIPECVITKNRGKPLHLDPDFKHLTYGDWRRRGRRLAELDEGDFIAFYAGLEPQDKKKRQLFYALIGFYKLLKPPIKDSDIDDIPKEQWRENAHTRFEFREEDENVIVRAKPGESGRLTKAIRIGTYRNNAYRVIKSVLNAWRCLRVTDGYIQRSGTTPWFEKPERFLNWFSEQRRENDIDLVPENGWKSGRN